MFKKKPSISDEIKLSQRQKANIKITLNETLKKYNLSNSAINIDLPINNTNDIKGPKNLDSLKNLVLKGLENECPLKTSEIIYSHFFRAGKEMELGISSMYWTAGGCFYFQIYMSNKELVIYGLDNYYRLIKSRTINISDMHSVGISSKDLDGLKLSRENLIMKINPSVDLHLSSYYLIPSKKDNTIELTGFKNLLISLGVPELIPPKKSIGVIITYIFIALIILFGTLGTINSL